MDKQQSMQREDPNVQMMKAAGKVYHDFQEMTKDPMNHQEAFLLKLLADNKDTEYGKKYGFAEITSIKEFQEKLPITTFDDYASYVERMSEKGENNLITAYPVNHYNKSSGTMGAAKRIPVSDLGVQTFTTYTDSYHIGMLCAQIGGEKLNGKVVSTVESVDGVEKVPCGATLGYISEKFLLEMRPFLEHVFTSPIEAVFPIEDSSCRYMQARFALMEPNAARYITTFANYAYELMRYIENNWEILVDDIAGGTINEKVPLDLSVRESLMKKIKPMPERAASLRAIFEQGFDKPFVPLVWPKMAVIATIGTGSFQIFADNLKNRYTGHQIPFYYSGLIASEGVLTVPVRINSPEAVPVLDTVFHEFLPIDAGDDFSKVVTIDQLEEGKVYEIIITNPSGFYRYRMRDAIRVVGMQNATPTMLYLYRLDNEVSLVGEKSSEEAIRFAAEETAKELGLELAGFSLYPDTESTPVRYQYFLEVAHIPTGVTPKIIRLHLEENIGKANPRFLQELQKGTCGPIRVNFLEPESYNLYTELKLFRGGSRSQIKPALVIHNEMQRKFFSGQTEDSCELTR